MLFYFESQEFCNVLFIMPIPYFLFFASNANINQIIIFLHLFVEHNKKNIFFPSILPKPQPTPLNKITSIQKLFHHNQ